MTVKKKLGKKEPRHDPRTLKLSSYFFGPKLPEIPSRKYWYDGVKYGMYKNDMYGDCTCASACNFVRSWSKNANVEIDLPDEAALEAYKAITGFDPEDPSTDNGAVELDVLKYWQKTGIGGHQIKAFVSVNVKHREELKAAIALFGGVYVGLGMPLGWESIEPGTKIWDVVEGPDGQIASWGGHAVPIFGFDEQGVTCVTWGVLQKITWDAFDKYCDEAWCILSEDFLKDGKAPSGFDKDQLLADLSLVSR